MNTDVCWKTKDHEMQIWAKDCDDRTPDDLGRHGLGSLDQPCLLVPGQPCPACGKEA